MAQKGYSENRRTLLIVFTTVCLDLIGFGIIIPIQPFLAQTLGATPALVTLLGASFSLMQFLFAPVWGRLSDRIGRRPVMLISIAVSAVGYLLFGLAGSLPLLFFARMLSGFGTANIGTAQAIIADCTSPETRARGMGLIGAAFGLGFILGPALGGVLGQFGLAAPAFAAAGFCTGNWFFAFFQLPETYQRRSGNGSTHHFFSLSALTRAARHPNVAQLLLLYLFYPIAFSLMEQVLGLFIEASWLVEKADVSASSHAKRAAGLTAAVLIVVGITSTIIQGGLIGRLARRFGERRLLMVGLVLMGFTFLAIPFVGSLGPFGLMLPVGALLATGSALANPSLTSLLSRAVGTDEQGGTLGLGQSLGALGRVVGPASAGFLFQTYRGLPFFFGSVLLFACSIISSTIRFERPTRVR